MIRLIFLFICLAYTPFVFSQDANVRGKLVDSLSNSALEKAFIMMVRTSDSLRISAESNADGRFVFEKVKPGTYILRTRYLGYAEVSRMVTVGSTDLIVGRILLNKESSGLDEISILEKRNPVSQRNDTTEINASEFKSNPHANAEDLVQKMPGISVQDGKIQAQGENVKQILLDGKPFFGEDPNAALQNIPADMIDKVQVFDQFSDQSLFSGFDDGQYSKTLNIITKQGMKNGAFGKAFGGYGYDAKWQGGGNVNIFKPNHRLTVIGQTNNINVQNFSSQDLMGLSGSQGGGNRSRPQGMPGRPGGKYSHGNDMSDFMVNQENGITTTYAGGLNYIGKWGKKIDFTGSYFFNYGENNVTQDLARQFVSEADTGLVYLENRDSESRNINHRFNIRFEYKPDSMNSVIVKPRFVLQQNMGNSGFKGTNRDFEKILNNSLNETGNNLSATVFSNEVLYRHRFLKRGRTVSFTLNNSYNNNSGNNNLLSMNEFFTGQNTGDTLDQVSTISKKGFSSSLTTAYTEPINNHSQILLHQSVSRQNTDSDKLTSDFNQTTSQYDLLAPALSNVFSTQFMTIQAGTGYARRGEKGNLTIRANYQYSALHSQKTLPAGADLYRNFHIVLPNLSYRYNVSRSKNFRLNYRSASNAPDVDQLQDVINNSNPMSLSSGNSSLVQDFQHNFFVRYSASSTEKNTSFFCMLGGSYTSNYLGNSTFIAPSDSILDGGILLARGARLSKPVNIEGFFNLRSYVNYGLPVKFIKSNANLFASMVFTRTPGIINGRLNYSRSPAVTGGISLSSNISEKTDFNISSSATYSIVDNTLQKELNTNYIMVNTKARANQMFAGGWLIAIDLNHQSYQGLTAEFNQNFALLTLAIGKRILKENADIRLSVFDLLNQNNSVKRVVTDSYIEDQRSDILRRYYMLTFTYNFRKFSKAKKKRKRIR